MEGSVPSSLATSTHASLGMHWVRCHSSSMAYEENTRCIKDLKSWATHERLVVFFNLLVSPGCRTRRHSEWSGVIPLKAEKKAPLLGSLEAAVSIDTSTASSQGSLWAAEVHPGWNRSALPSPTASLLAGITGNKKMSFFNPGFLRIHCVDTNQFFRKDFLLMIQRQ